MASELDFGAIGLIVQLQRSGDLELMRIGGVDEVHRLFLGSFINSSTVSVNQSIDFLIELEKRREFARKMEDILTYRIRQLNIPFTRIVELATEAFTALITDTKQNGNQLAIISSSIDRTANAIVEKTLNKRAGIQPGIPTGFIDIDIHTGGWQANDLIIIGARPGVGKSSFALSTCMKISETAPVAFFSLEMDNQSMQARCISMKSGINSETIRDGNLTDTEIDKVLATAQQLKSLNYWGTDKFSPSIDFVVSECRKLAAKQGQLGAIAIDYLQLMVVKQENSLNEVSDITRKLKLLAVELKCPIFGLSQLNRSVESRNDKRPIKSDLRDSGCLTGDTLIEMADTGVRVPIKELQGLSGFNVWSLNQTTLKLEKALVSNAFSTGMKQTFVVTTKLGKVIRATGNHKFLKIDGWHSLDEIVAGDYIALPRAIPAAAKIQTMSDNELALLAHLTGDGCVLPSHAIQYTTGCEFLANLVKDIGNSVFGDKLKIRISPERNWIQVYLASAERLTHGKHNPIVTWFKALGIYGLRSYEKFVPDLVFNQPNAAIAIFLGHLWATDGSVTLGKKNRIGLHYSSSSRKLANDVQSLLLRLGIISIIYKTGQGKHRDNFSVCVSGKSNTLNFFDKIKLIKPTQISSAELIVTHYKGVNERVSKDIIPKLALEKAGISSSNNVWRGYLPRFASLLGSEELNTLAESDIYWDEVKSIEIDAIEELFDLTVPGNSNFLANDILVHNSLEQDSDIIIMLYRDILYNPDTLDRNVAEVIFRKFRNGREGTLKLTFDGSTTQFKNLAKY